MRTQLTYDVTINAPASKVWRVLAHEFENIEQWSSGIKTSKATTNGKIPEGAAVAGRSCDAIQEEFTNYDEQAKQLGYKMIDPPWFIRYIGNNWSVREVGPNQSVVEIRPEAEFNPVFGLILIPLLKIGGRYMANQTFEELKYYVEHDEPHPRKQKALRKQMKTA